MSKSSETSTKKIASFEPRESTMDTQPKVFISEIYLFEKRTTLYFM